MHISSLATASVLLATCISYVNAKAVATAPVGSKWKAGSKNIITWEDDNKEPLMPSTFDISLMRGGVTSLQLVNTIEKDISSSLGQYEWEIPANLEPASDYAIRFGVGSEATYSPAFTILSSDGTSAGGSSSGTNPPVDNGGNSSNNQTNNSTDTNSSDRLQANPIAVISTLITIGCLALQLS